MRHYVVCVSILSPCITCVPVCMCRYLTWAQNNRYTGKTYVSYAMLETLIVIPCIINTDQFGFVSPDCAAFSRLNWIIRAGSICSHINMESSDCKHAKSPFGYMTRAKIGRYGRRKYVHSAETIDFAFLLYYKIAVGICGRARILLSVPRQMHKKALGTGPKSLLTVGQ